MGQGHVFSINPALLDALRGNPDSQPRAILYAGLSEGRWSWTDVEAFETAFEADPRFYLKKERTAPVGKKYVTRSMRCQKRRAYPYRYIRRHGIAPVLDGTLSSGALRTLEFIIARCGKGQFWSTLTSWIAHDLGLHVRTIQNHLRALHGRYIAVSSPDQKTQKITITVLPSSEVQPPRVFKKMRETQAALDVGAKKISPTHETSSEKKKSELDNVGEPSQKELFGANSSQEPEAAFEGSATGSCSRREGSLVETPPFHRETTAHDRTRKGHSAGPRGFGRRVEGFDDTIDAILAKVGLSLPRFNRSSPQVERNPSLPGTQLAFETNDASSDDQERFHGPSGHGHRRNRQPP